MEQDFKDVFDAKLCELPGVTSLQLKPDVVPVVMVNRRVPVSIRPQLGRNEVAK